MQRVSLVSRALGIRTTSTFVPFQARAVSQVAFDPENTAEPRIQQPRNDYLLRLYTNLLDNAQAVLIFQPNNLNTKETSALRRAISAVPMSADMLPTTPRSQPLAKFEIDETLEAAKARLTVVRTGPMGAVSSNRQRTARKKNASGSDSTSAHNAPDITPLLSGSVAIVTVPTISPPYLKRVLAAINKEFGFRPPPISARGGTSLTSPRFMLLGAILEQNRLLSTGELQSVLSLPDLSTLRAQLVGTLETPARQLLGLTQQAAGGDLVRTLLGLEQTLKEGDEPK